MHHLAELIRSKKKRIFDILQIGNKSDWGSRLFDYFIVAVILINITAMFLQTFHELKKYDVFFAWAENVTVLIFCVEYALRIWTSDYLYPELTRKRAVIKFLFSFDGIIDFLTILPFFYLSGFIAFRMLRVVRIFHLFRINAYYDSFNVIKTVLYEKRNQIASSVFIIIVLMLASSLFMYSAEHEAQPEVFRNAFSGIWWSMSTLLTVGYGDIYPITMAGRLMGIVIAFLGVGAVAIPTGIISAGFVEQYGLMLKSSPAPGTLLQTVGIDIDSKWLGLSLEELEHRYDIVVIMAQRDDVSIPLNDSYRIGLKDVLTVCQKSADTPS